MKKLKIIFGSENQAGVGITPTEDFPQQAVGHPALAQVV
jgi:hypothetical protein